MERPHGVIVPVATPLNDRGELNETAFRSLIRAQLPHVDGIFVLGSSGEFAWLRNSVAETVRRIAREETVGKPLFIGVGDTSVERTLDRLGEPGVAEADFVVVTPPYYYPVDQAALVGYFAEVADNSHNPVVLYNIPQNVGVTIEPASVSVLAQHPNIEGIKDSAGDMFAFLRMLEFRSERFSVLQGREQLLSASFFAGADGIVSSLGNIAPSLLRAAIDATQTGDRDRALELQAEITAVAELFGEGYWLAALKSALAVLGFDVGSLVSPMPACTAEQQSAIAARLQALPAHWLISSKEDARG